jgi:hypothetical protein
MKLETNKGTNNKAENQQTKLVALARIISDKKTPKLLIAAQP